MSKKPHKIKPTRIDRWYSGDSQIVDQCVKFLIYVLRKKLNFISQNQREVYLNLILIKHPSFAEFADFLNEECELWEKSNAWPGKSQKEILENLKNS